MARKELPEGTVLLDVTDVSYASFAKEFLERTGHQALVCHGPSEGLCPLLAGAGCDKIDAAHGVVFQFELLADTDVGAREPTAGDLDAFAAQVEAADKSRGTNT